MIGSLIVGRGRGDRLLFLRDRVEGDLLLVLFIGVLVFRPAGLFGQRGAENLGV